MDGTVLSPLRQCLLRAVNFTLPLGGSKARDEPSGRGDGGAQHSLPTENPPRKLAHARFRPSRAREGGIVVGHSADGTILSPLRQCLLRAVNFTLPLGGSKARDEPSGRGDGGAQHSLPTENPPRRLAHARFRPSRAREGEIVVGHSAPRLRVGASHA
jgi:hypothetical protein